MLETVVIVAYVVIALFFMGVVFHYKPDNEVEAGFAGLLWPIFLIISLGMVVAERLERK